MSSQRRRQRNEARRAAARERGPQRPARPPAADAPVVEARQDVFQPSTAMVPPPPPEPEPTPEEPVDDAPDDDGGLSRASLWLFAKGWYAGFEDDDDLSALDAAGLVDDDGEFTELGHAVAEELDATTGGDDGDEAQAVESTSETEPEAEAAAEADGPAA